ncbi:MAG: DUF4915 domain-containing protein [Acidobacteriota bacterium]
MPGTDAHLLVYNEGGLDRHYALPKYGDAHHVAFDGTDYLVTSTSTNSIVRLSPNGEIREWRADGKGDAWHLNGVFVRDGSVYACAFGRFSEDLGWKPHARNGTGVVFDIRTGEDVLRGLRCPHHPVWINGSWLVCNSAEHELLDMDEKGGVRRRLRLGGWTRGIAVYGDLVFAGISAPRHDANNLNTSASFAIVSLSSWELLDQVPVPSVEIGDLEVVPASLVDAVRRAGPCVDKLNLQMLPLAPIENGSIRLEALEIPRAVGAGSHFECRVRLENLTPHVLQSIQPNPVHLSYHWADRGSGEVIVFDGERTRLTFAVAGGSVTFHTLNVQAPASPGDRLLQLTLVQEAVRWFDAPPTYMRAEVPVLVTP